MKRAVWENKSRRITGYWEYNWSAEQFVIQLDSVDRITGRNRNFVVKGDKPEWGNWRLVPS